MSNSSPSPEGSQSSEATTTPEPETEQSDVPLFEDAIPQARHFPVITIVLSLDDPGEPNHVDLGSVPPQIAAGALESIASHLKKLTWPSRVTYAGHTIFDPEQMIPDMDDDDLPSDGDLC
jgi:hypothetical protein